MFILAQHIVDQSPHVFLSGSLNSTYHLTFYFADLPEFPVHIQSTLALWTPRYYGHPANSPGALIFGGAI